MTGRLTCDDVRDRELIERYAAGTLGEPEAEALEAHAFDCEACWVDMQTAVEIRAAMTTPVRETNQVQNLATERDRRRQWRVPVPLALAAAALLGIGLTVVTKLSWPTQQPPVMRSAVADGIEVKASQQDDGSLKIEWASHPSASDYLVTVRVGGAIALTRETTEIEIVVPRDRLTSGSQALVEVTAQSADGGTVGTGSRELTIR